MTPNKLPPLPESIYSDDDLCVIVQDWDALDADQLVSINLARECLQHREAIRQSQSLPAGAVAGRKDGEPGKDRLWDSQWVNVVNHDDRYRDYTKDDAVDKAVKLTELMMAQNFRAALQADAREKGEAVGEKVIEQVAHAMHASENKTSGREWEDCSPIELDGWRELALAAIREMQSIGLATQPAQASEPTGKFRAALLWLLWCHQGGSSEVGQPIRAMLGIGSHDCMTDEQVAEAKTYATHPQPVTPAGGEVVAGRITGYLPRQRCIEIQLDEALPDGMLGDYRRAYVTTHAALDAVGQEGKGHNADWCAGWNAHNLLTANPPVADAALAVDDAMIDRATAAFLKDNLVQRVVDRVRMKAAIDAALNQRGGGK